MFPNTAWEAQQLRVFVHHMQRLKEDIPWRPSTLLIILNLLKWLFLKNRHSEGVTYLWSTVRYKEGKKSHARPWALSIGSGYRGLVTVASDIYKFPLFLFPLFYLWYKSYNMLLFETWFVFHRYTYLRSRLSLCWTVFQWCYISELQTYLMYYSNISCVGLFRCFI